MCVTASGEHFERSLLTNNVLRAERQYFRFNPRAFANNNVKLHYVLSQFWLQ